MNAKELIAKLTKGEKLTDAEAKFLNEYDPQKQADEAAAAARRAADAKLKEATDALAKYKSEQEAAAAKAEEERKAKLTEQERLQESVKTLTSQIADLQKANAESEAKAAQLARTNRIGQIRQAHKISFVDGVDADLAAGAFSKAFDGFEDFDNADEVASRVKGFTERNKALIIDTSGAGTGEPAGESARSAQLKKVEEMSHADREADLRKKGII